MTDTRIFKLEKARLICPECNQDIPRRYQDDYARFLPAVMSTVGFRGHGKTVYLAALFHVLSYPELGRYWEDFFTLPLDMETLSTLNNNATLLDELKLPDATPRNFPKPAIIQVTKIPFMCDSTLLCYDAAGESFENIKSFERNAGFVVRSKSVLFLLSVTDLSLETQQYGGNIPKAMDWLLTVYLNGVAELRNARKLPLAKQHLIVVYTKADEWVADLADEYSQLQHYLTNGTVEGLRDHQDYMKKLHAVSSILEKFTRGHLQATQFLNKARHHFASVKFCLISALGAQPMDDGTLAAEISPKRVLDPLLLTMENDNKRKGWLWRIFSTFRGK
ncbi:MAG: hypothetical protein GY862_07980 [Gammaproteobacteria bacterium]|nr:hypothetical protein [Gammaproteobacteria bacterium]